jgi:hypothetical protein
MLQLWRCGRDSLRVLGSRQDGGQGTRSQEPGRRTTDDGKKKKRERERESPIIVVMKQNGERDQHA